MNTYTTTQNAEADRIRYEYISHDDNKFEQLKKMDNKVKLPGKVVSSILGVIGALVMGAGMAGIMVVGISALGLVLGIVGMLVALVAYPIYSLITNSRKKKYASEVFVLSSQVTGQ